MTRTTPPLVLLMAAAGVLVGMGCDHPRPVTMHQSIYALQDDSRVDFVATDQPVQLLGVAITALDDHGSQRGDIYVQEVDGGPFSGVRVIAPVRVGDATRLFRIGDRVIVVGTKVEQPDASGGPHTETALDAATVELMGPGESLLPATVTATTIADATSAEPFEGVLVALPLVRMLAHDGEGGALLTSGLIVGDDLSDATFWLLPMACYQSVVGLVTGRGQPVLMPRSPEDLVLASDNSACEMPPSEHCDDGADNDQDGFVDCLDSDCWASLLCQPESICDDDLDNDGDDRIDCDDSDCMDHVTCRETDCINGLDDDGDGRVDCLDSDCDPEPHCWESPCDDGLDNDGDGRIDCQEFGCRNASGLCREFSLAECTDGIDNDGDGLVDCEDDACRFHPEMLTGAVCSDEVTDAVCDDGIDNDGDSYTDCADWDCHLNPFVSVCAGVVENTVELCSDGIDNNGNGLPDCADKACQRLGLCVSAESSDASCTDGLDNDSNGFIDCDDWACAFNRDVTVCEGDMVSCADGLDNDGNGLADCEDPACRECDAQGNQITRTPVCPICPIP